MGLRGRNRSLALDQTRVAVARTNRQAMLVERRRRASRYELKGGCLYNHYPSGEGLATSPGRRARLRCHSPFPRVR